ncbi:hypothetical protein AJ85_16645 [Alkalihalobacillus alcalophilus ATCC 27647 = CGMCC 1.3604]|uniref:Uncharacterized protein n=1 Tax=Alkalihalobacillus alcalophilus ATCC 27647 = CGMCC 1.3604 TaxID=1218173 RepID=A0A094YUX8_ALKAL|nr:hypothetical protein [Alkalihalobacillus alcalophilus]KGA97307.1 hypothetical protein BALCAV_0210880 [Alkalihalobacillus alcalophilus ATCC 27647 = CGMCC 1.3604]MED1562516.1 hypothetical protein [Alkalihalobacillus alcalophilus]THG92145.1 hypothetical protein AJ85_16645 [Alkalihalobacillus alcalophilus ATCC 27647 = CGMCC 1.3604]
MTNQISKDSLTKLTATQLQQRIIHLQSELKKYKYLVEQYQNNYHYNLIDTLKEENELKNQEIDELNEALQNEKKNSKNIFKEVSRLKEKYEQDLQTLRQLNESLKQEIQQIQQTKQIENVTNDSAEITDSNTKDEEIYPFLQKNYSDYPTKKTQSTEEKSNSWFYRNFQKKNNED